VPVKRRAAVMMPLFTTGFWEYKKMKKQLTIFILFLLGCMVGGLPKSALAFSCTSNGVSIVGTGTFTIPIDVTLNKSTDSIVLTDMSQYTNCFGQTGYNDALRTTGASISPLLTGLGFSGFANIYGTSYNFPLSMQCVWPDAGCSTNYPNIQYTPVGVQIGMRRTSASSMNGITLPAGTEIARLSIQQRSISTWGWDKTWIFTLKNSLVIPAYTCTINNPNLTVNLPSVKKTDLQNNGVGRYPAATPFNLNLTCDPDTTVSVKFDGTSIAGKDNILANTSTGNDAVGIQMVFNGNPITLGQTLQVINNSQAQETLSFNAYYYYNGGVLSGGPVTSVATYTLSYN
jgi:hypothetical protein